MKLSKKALANSRDEVASPGTKLTSTPTVTCGVSSTTKSQWYLLTAEKPSNTAWTSRNFSESSLASYLSGWFKTVCIDRHTRVVIDTLTAAISS